MNIIITPADFDIQHVFFTDTKNNIMMEGIFKKIIYSNQCILLNGIFIELQKVFIKSNLQPFFDLEKSIIQNYKTLYGISKRENYTFQKQYEQNSIRIYKERPLSLNTVYVMKISGIWETSTDFGMTYKIIEKSVLWLWRVTQSNNPVRSYRVILLNLSWCHDIIY